MYIGATTGSFLQFGELRFSSNVATFNTSNQFLTQFPQSGTIILGDNSAWGKYGVNQVLVSVQTPGGGYVLNNVSMSFTSGINKYNFVYSFSYNNLGAGHYHVKVFIQDANPKDFSNNPRCCGFVLSLTNFTISD